MRAWFDLLGKKDAEVTQIVSGGSYLNRVAQLLEERVGIASPKIIVRIQSQCTRPRGRFSVGDGSRRRARSIDAVRASTQHGDGLARDFLHTLQDESRVSPAYATTRDWGAHFAVRDHGRAAAWIRALQVGELRQEEIRRALDGPIVGGVITYGDESGRLGGPVRGMKQIVASKQNLKNGMAKRGIVTLRCFAHCFVAFKSGANRRGEFRQQRVEPDHGASIGYRRGIGKSRA